MARKQKHPEHVNHERWLVSYADFITLLFAFFVVMFAVSQVDSKKVGRFTQSFNQALEWQVLDSGGRGIFPNDDTKRTPEHKVVAPVEQGAKVSVRRAIARKMGASPALRGLKLEELHGELVLRLPERLMFDVGDARLRDDGTAAIDAIGEALRDRDVSVRVEGHTDNAPIHTLRFPSNWELSTARATAVVGHLIETKALAPVRLSAAGYSEYHPLADNGSSDGRALNRRVDVIVVVNGESVPATIGSPPGEPAAEVAPAASAAPPGAGEAP